MTPHPAPHGVLRDDGSTLAFVLVVLTFVSTLAAALALAVLTRDRLAHRDVWTLQARYAAESGLHAAIMTLEQGQAPAARTVRLPGGDTAHVAIERFGGLWAARSTANVHGAAADLYGFIGQRPPPYLHAALIATDTSRAVHLAGQTRVSGDAWTGAQGLRPARIRATLAAGRHRGTTHTLTPSDLERLVVDPSAYTETLAAARALLATAPGVHTRVRVFGAAARLAAPDGGTQTAGSTVAAHGRLDVAGPLTLAPGLRVVAADTLRLSGDVRGGPALFVSLRAISIEPGASVVGQFVAPDVRVSTGARALYPSAMLSSASTRDGPAIRVDAGAGVDGTLVFASRKRSALDGGPSIRIASGALVRGAVLNSHTTEMAGTLHGTLLTTTLYHYEPPTRYVGWLRDARLSAHERPAPYALPTVLGRSTRLALIEVHDVNPLQP